MPPSRDSVINDSNLTLSSVIDDLEKKRYQNSFNDGILSKINEFSNWLNSSGRIELLKCSNQSQSELSLFLLLSLKKTIKSAISEIGLTLNNVSKVHTCPRCDTVIEIKPYEDYWETLQNHHHFEEIYLSRMNDDVLEVDDEVPSCSSEETATQSSSNYSPDNGGNPLNDFKFNFNIKYDSIIENTLYPANIMQAARKFDKIKDFTMQRCGTSISVCLLCPCNIVQPRGRNGKVQMKMSTFLVKNHVSGQKHMRCANSTEHQLALSKYHEFWLSQDLMYQAHQVYFVPQPEHPDSAFCVLCSGGFWYKNVIQHILEKAHATCVVELYHSPEGKLNYYYLLDLQVQVYGITDAKPKTTNNCKEMITNHQNSKSGTSPKANQPKTNQKNDEKPASHCDIIKSLQHSNLDQGIMLPFRYKEHEKFFVKLQTSLRCTLCKVNVASDPLTLTDHIHLAPHRQLCGIQNKLFLYFCDICNITVKNEAEWALHFTRGPNKHQNLGPVRKAQITEYQCKSCSLIIYGDELSITRHRNAVSGKRGRKKAELTLPLSVKKLFRSKDFIFEVAERLSLEATEVLECTNKMENCCKTIETVLSSVFPNCKAFCFGSRVSGLGNYQSDLDIFLDVGDMYEGEINQGPLNQVDIVRKASRDLKLSKDFTQVFPIPAARTPIVKLHHGCSDLDCDISFRHGLGVENTKFLRFCMELQPITQSFILFLKKWSGLLQLNEHLTNYALALMAVFYLQRNLYLPSVKTIRNCNPSEALIIDGWETINYTIPAEDMREFVKDFDLDLKQLLRNFFDYFSTFNYGDEVICPLLGNTVPKVWFSLEEYSTKLPLEMNSYKQRLIKEDAELFRALSPFCIQDPFDLSHNLTKACPDSVLKKFKTFCFLTVQHLDSIQ